MSINHHPDKSTLMSYAAGTLDEAFAVVVSCHLELCASCRSSYEALEAIGGAELESVEVTSVDEGAFGRVLEKISASDVLTDESVKNASPTKASPNQPFNALSGYMVGDLHDVSWKRVGPGVWQHPIGLSKDANSSLRLLRIAPGKSVPDHGHNGQEITMIIGGAYKDEIGYFGPGDVADLDEHIEHQPFVVSQEDCICLAATEAPTRFKGLVGKIMQPFIGI